MGGFQYGSEAPEGTDEVRGILDSDPNNPDPNNPGRGLGCWGVQERMSGDT